MCTVCTETAADISVDYGQNGTFSVILLEQLPLVGKIVTTHKYIS
jgi:hypothetical protein